MTSGRLTRSALILGFLLFIAPEASGCTVCGSGTGKEVRAGISQNAFGLNFLAVIAPLPVLIGLVFGLAHLLGKETDHEPAQL